LVKRIQFDVGKILFTSKRSEWSMNRYKIVGNLSAGAHGNVFKAVRLLSYNAQLLSSQVKDGKYFAIKRVFFKKLNSILSILREIKSLQYLDNHPNVSSFETHSFSTSFFCSCYIWSLSFFLLSDYSNLRYLLPRFYS